MLNFGLKIQKKRKIAAALVFAGVFFWNGAILHAQEAPEPTQQEEELENLKSDLRESQADPDEASKDSSKREEQQTRRDQSRDSRPTTDEDQPKTLEDRFIESNISISEWFDGVAEGLDLFLVGRRITKRPNETRVIIENITTVREYDGLTNDPGVSVNLRLPNFEEYWQLKFTSYDERRDQRRGQRNYLPQAPRERNYGATVGLFRKLGNVRTAFQPRIELQDPLKVSHSLAFESVADYKTFELNPKLEFFANATEGTGVFTALNFNIVLSKDYSLTFINEGEYLEKTHLYDVTNGFALGQVIDERSAFSYGIHFNSNNQPSYHLETYSVGVTWSQLIYKKILDYQLSPHLLFQKARNFEAQPGLSVTLTLSF